jgi:hypothetical protein
VSCFDIPNFSQLVDRDLIYEESLKKNSAEYMDQKRKAQGSGFSAKWAGPAKRMAVGSFSPQRSQGCTSGNPPIPLPRSQI